MEQGFGTLRRRLAGLASASSRAWNRLFEPCVLAWGSQPGAPLLGVPLRRLGLREESLEHRDEALGRLELRQMTDLVEDLEAAARDGLVGLFAVADRDHRIVLAPDDENGHALGEVQPVAGVDALTFGADDRAQCGQERGATVWVGERGVSARDLGDVRVWSQPDGCQATCHRRSRRRAPALLSRR